MTTSDRCIHQPNIFVLVYIILTLSTMCESHHFAAVGWEGCVKCRTCILVYLQHAGDACSFTQLETS